MSLTDSQLDAMFDELASARENVTSSTSEGGDFICTVLGGSWTLQHLGRSHDAYRGQVARSASEAAAFAKEYGLQTSSRYNVDLYGEEGALTLAYTWAAKAQHFYDIWKKQPNPAYAFTDQDFASWQPGHRFLELLGILTGRALQRARGLRDYRPARQ